MAVEPEFLLHCLTEQGTAYAIILLDTDGTIVDWLAGAEKTFGYSREEAVGRNLRMLFTPEDAALGIPEHELKVARSNGRAEDDRWMARKDGGRFWANGTSAVLFDEEGVHVGFGKILRDRTELREQIEAFENEARAAAAESERKNRFIALLGHEIRNPLNVISLCASGLERLAPGPAGELIRTIDEQVRFMARLVEDLQEASRANSNKLPLSKESVVLQDVLARAAEAVRPHAEQRGQSLQALLMAGPIKMQIDPDRIRQAVTNLLENAVKNTPHGGTIWLKCTIEGHEAVVRVEDNGVGIDKDALPGLFDLFTRSRRNAAARDRLGANLGLGLPLVKELATLHGGTVQVRSDGPGKGAEFTMRLPLDTD